MKVWFHCATAAEQKTPTMRPNKRELDALLVLLEKQLLELGNELFKEGNLDSERAKYLRREQEMIKGMQKDLIEALGEPKVRFRRHLEAHAAEVLAMMKTKEPISERGWMPQEICNTVRDRGLSAPYKRDEYNLTYNALMVLVKHGKVVRLREGYYAAKHSRIWKINCL